MGGIQAQPGLHSLLSEHHNGYNWKEHNSGVMLYNTSLTIPTIHCVSWVSGPHHIRSYRRTSVVSSDDLFSAVSSFSFFSFSSSSFSSFPYIFSHYFSSLPSVALFDDFSSS